MADIDIERKGAAPVWPWILLGVLVLALLLWWLLGRNGDDRVATDPVTPAATMPADTVARTGAIPPALDEYLTFTQTADPAGEMGRQHEYTAGGLRRLADAIDAVVQQDTVGDAAIQPRLQEFRAQADRLQDTPEDSPQHANFAREAFTSAGELLETIRANRHPGVGGLQGQVQQTQQAAADLRPGEPLLDQAERVQRFFDQAGTALRTMAEAPTTGRF
jgi:hypothetical protein